MKRLFIITLTFLLLLGADVAKPQVEIPLSETHWAYRDLATLARDGLVPGFAPEDFDGRRQFTREDIARAITATRDAYTNSPASFSASHLALLKKLQKEFQNELEQLGDNRPLPDAELSPAVPPSHWAYQAFETFAGNGLIDVPAHRFEGGRIYSRAEMAELTRQLIAMEKKDSSKFTNLDARMLIYLQMEFRDELESHETVATSSAPGAQPAPWTISGTGNLYIGVTKGNKSSIATRLTLNAVAPRLESYFAGDVDNSDRSGSDVDFGRAYTFDLSRKLVGWHSDKNDTQRDDYLLIGDVNNIDFDEGLVAGAMNVKGAYASAGSPGRRSMILWGEDSSGREISGARYSRKMGADTRIAALILREYINTGDLKNSAAIHMNRSFSSRRLAVEFAKAQGAGHGVYTSWRRTYSDAFSALAEYRYYRDFTLDHNNPPRYLGRSGGNGENEKSMHVRLQWRMGGKWSFILSRDHIYSPLTGRKTNVFFAQEYKPDHSWVLAWSVEKERGNGQSESERAIRLRYSGFKETTLAGTWKRAVRPSGPSSTTRLDVTHPIMNHMGRLLFSFTRRKASSRRTHSYRMRVSRRMGAGNAVSVSYDYTGTATNRLDMNMTWKY